MKKWYKSKMLWVNAIAIAGIIIRSEMGYTFTPEIELMILGAINMILRVITKEEIVW
jgi:hypothetical protein